MCYVNVFRWVFSPYFCYHTLEIHDEKDEKYNNTVFENQIGTLICNPKHYARQHFFLLPIKIKKHTGIIFAEMF